MHERRGLRLSARRPERTLEWDVLTLHLILQAAVSGRATHAHAYRAAVRAAQSARPLVWGRICPICSRDLGRSKPTHVWVIYKGAAYRVGPDNVLARGRVYCSQHCADAQLARESRPAFAEGVSREQ